MKTRTSGLWMVILALVLILLGGIALALSLIFAPNEPTAQPQATQPPIITGWQTKDDGTYLYDDTGAPVTGLYPASTGTFYFDENGRMVTGWVDFPEGKRYFAESGGMQMGFLKLDGKQYCFDADGLMLTGWQELQEQRYYFTESGAMAIGWQEINEGKLYFDENGQVQTGWLHLEEGTWYLQEDGTAYTGWMRTDEMRRYFREDGKMATGMIQIDGKNRLFSPDGNYIPLVNPWNQVPDDYSHNLVDIEGLQMDASCVEQLRAMITAARTAGLTVVLNSSYRDMNTQIYLWNRRYDDYISQGYSEEEAYRLTARRVAYPGTSEHHTGLAIDIVEIIKDGTLYAWFNEHAWEYGFIVRYKGEKEELTGIKDEPWHLRYVGRDVAQVIHERDICLEEYFNELLPQA